MAVMPRDPFAQPGDPDWMVRARARPYPDEVTALSAALERWQASGHRAPARATESEEDDAPTVFPKPTAPARHRAVKRHPVRRRR